MTMDGIRGDHRRKVEVTMPRSLQELRQAASSHFGQQGRGPHRLHHFGVTAITHHDHVKQLEDEDVVVVSWRDREVAVPRHGITTHQADYGPKPIEAWTSPTPRAPGSPLPFEAVSSYTRDYPARPMSEQRRRPPPQEPFVKEPFTTRTTYADHFPGHNAESCRQMVPAALRQQPLPNTRFDAETTHQKDFVRHHVVPQLRERTDHFMPQRLFEGTTTYGDHYTAKKGEFPKTRRPGYGKTHGFPRPPFRGRSEYNTEFLEKAPHHNPKIFLVPEDQSGGVYADLGL